MSNCWCLDRYIYLLPGFCKEQGLGKKVRKIIDTIVITNTLRLFTRDKNGRGLQKTYSYYFFTRTLNLLFKAVHTYSSSKIKYYARLQSDRGTIYTQLAVHHWPNATFLSIAIVSLDPRWLNKQ